MNDITQPIKLKTVYPGKSLHNIVWAMMMREMIKLPISNERRRLQHLCEHIRIKKSERRAKRLGYSC